MSFVNVAIDKGCVYSTSVNMKSNTFYNQSSQSVFAGKTQSRSCGPLASASLVSRYIQAQYEPCSGTQGITRPRVQALAKPVAIANQSFAAGHYARNASSMETSCGYGLTQAINAGWVEHSAGNHLAHQHSAMISATSGNRASSRYGSHHAHHHHQHRQHYQHNHQHNSNHSPHYHHFANNANSLQPGIINRTSRSDVLLDRKAFMSLEKSINWQSLISSSSTTAEVASAPTTAAASIVKDHRNKVICVPSSLSSFPPSPPPTSTKSTVVQSNLPSSFSSFASIEHLSNHASSLSASTAVATSMLDAAFINDENSSLSSSTTGKQSEVSVNVDLATTSDIGFNQPGMRDVPAWLKLLRLHKYAPLFERMSFERMVELTEEDLASRNITTGARHKLIQSIGKLKLRSNLVLMSEYSLFVENSRHYNLTHSYHTLSQTLFHVRGFLSTPICPSNLGSLSSPASPPVDLNNNNGDSATQSNRDHERLLRSWKSLALSNANLPEIITRLLGHVHNILVCKSKRRLEKLNLWQDHFKDIHEQFILANENLVPREKDDNIQQIAQRNSLVINNNGGNHCDHNDLDREENDEEDDEDGSDNNTDNASPKTQEGDSGGDSDGSDRSLTQDEELELYKVMDSILERCLSHEAFAPHQMLLCHWRNQLEYMQTAVRCTNPPPPPAPAVSLVSYQQYSTTEVTKWPSNPKASAYKWSSLVGPRACTPPLCYNSQPTTYSSRTVGNFSSVVRSNTPRTRVSNNRQRHMSSNGAALLPGFGPSNHRAESSNEFMNSQARMAKKQNNVRTKVARPSSESQLNSSDAHEEPSSPKFKFRHLLLQHLAQTHKQQAETNNQRSERSLQSSFSNYCQDNLSSSPFSALSECFTLNESSEPDLVSPKPKASMSNDQFCDCFNADDCKVELTRWNDRLSRDLHGWASSLEQDDDWKRELDKNAFHSLSDTSPTESEWDSFDDIEQLCVRMAEHALDSATDDHLDVLV